MFKYYLFKIYLFFKALFEAHNDMLETIKNNKIKLILEVRNIDLSRIRIHVWCWVPKMQRKMCNEIAIGSYQKMYRFLWMKASSIIHANIGVEDLHNHHRWDYCTREVSDIILSLVNRYHNKVQGINEGHGKKWYHRPIY